MDSIDDWAARAACLGLDPDALFVQGAAQNRAKAICFGCPVRTECLADSLDHRVEFGVWGGMTERERRGLLRRRPNVTLWRHLLENAKGEYEQAHDMLPSLAAVPSPGAVPVPPLAPSLPVAS
jgi:WhiB family redox-sensing transcriptional regulator